MDCVKVGPDNSGIGKIPLSIYTFDVMCNERFSLQQPDGSVPFRAVELLQSRVPKDFIATYNEGLNMFLEGHWSDCLGFIEKCLEMVPDDRPSKKMLDIIDRKGGRAPSDWEGFRRLS